jgi:hypothetical protein
MKISSPIIRVYNPYGDPIERKSELNYAQHAIRGLMVRWKTHLFLGGVGLFWAIAAASGGNSMLMVAAIIAVLVNVGTAIHLSINESIEFEHGQIMQLVLKMYSI